MTRTSSECACEDAVENVLRRHGATHSPPWGTAAAQGCGRWHRDRRKPGAEGRPPGGCRSTRRPLGTKARARCPRVSSDPSSEARGPSDAQWHFVSLQPGVHGTAGVRLGRSGGRRAPQPPSCSTVTPTQTSGGKSPLGQPQNIQVAVSSAFYTQEKEFMGTR